MVKMKIIFDDATSSAIPKTRLFRMRHLEFGPNYNDIGYLRWKEIKKYWNKKGEKKV